MDHRFELDEMISAAVAAKPATCSYLDPADYGS